MTEPIQDTRHVPPAGLGPRTVEPPPPVGAATRAPEEPRQPLATLDSLAIGGTAADAELRALVDSGRDLAASIGALEALERAVGSAGRDLEHEQDRLAPSGARDDAAGGEERRAALARRVDVTAAELARALGGEPEDARTAVEDGVAAAPRETSPRPTTLAEASDVARLVDGAAALDARIDALTDRLAATAEHISRSLEELRETRAQLAERREELSAGRDRPNDARTAQGVAEATADQLRARDDRTHVHRRVDEGRVAELLPDARRVEAPDRERVDDGSAERRARAEESRARSAERRAGFERDDGAVS